MFKRRKQKKKGGTAPRSLTLTYAQLEFLDGLSNASAWVRDAIDEVREIRNGRKVVIDKPLAEHKREYWARLVEKGFECRMTFGGTLGAFDRIIKQAMNLEDAFKEAERLDKAAGESGERPFNDFMMPAHQIANSIEKIIKDGQKPRP